MPGLSVTGTFPSDVGEWYESSVKGAYYIGWHMHAHDWRQGAGGFVSGFRYLIRNLWHHIDGVGPRKVSMEEIPRILSMRLWNASDLVIMQDGRVIRDIFVPTEERGSFLYYEGYNYNFFDKRADAFTFYFGWGNIRDVRTIFGEQYWTDQDNR